MGKKRSSKPGTPVRQYLHGDSVEEGKPGGVTHQSRPKVNDAGVPRYERSSISPLALAAWEKMNSSGGTSPQQSQSDEGDRDTSAEAAAK
jgi:hypothetical protein